MSFKIQLHMHAVYGLVPYIYWAASFMTRLYSRDRYKNDDVPSHVILYLSLCPPTLQVFFKLIANSVVLPLWMDSPTYLILYNMMVKNTICIHFLVLQAVSLYLFISIYVFHYIKHNLINIQLWVNANHIWPTTLFGGINLMIN